MIRNTIIGTKEAFLTMLMERGVYKKLNVSTSTVTNWKQALTGVTTASLGDPIRNMPSVNLMEDLLVKYGASSLSEKVWQVPSRSQNMFDIIMDVVITNHFSENKGFNSQLSVCMHDDTHWRNVGTANAKLEKRTLKADITIYSDFNFESYYPKISQEDNIIHTIMLIHPKYIKHIEPGLKSLRAYSQKS